SFLNIAGLGTGLAVAILIFNYSYNESRADKYHENIDNIYLLENKNSTRVHYEIEPLVREQVPAIEHIVIVEAIFRDMFVLKYKNEESIKTDLVFTESDFLKIFSFDVISGNLEDAFEAPYSIILTESEAKRIFGDKNAVGESLSLKGNPVYLGESEVTVKAVIEDLPHNSNLQFKSLVTRSTAKRMMPFIDQCNWGCQNVQNYVTLKKGQDPEILAKQMSEQLRPFIPEKIACDFSFFPYSDAYFSSIRDDFKHGNLKMIYTLSSIALLILLIATINYINLSMAGSAKRLTEVGVRKIVGVRPFQLIRQLLGESVLLSIVSMVIGLVLANLLTPAINSLSVIRLPDIPMRSISFWLFLVGASVLIGVLAGLTPALALNKFRPISLITGRTSNTGSGTNIKRGLIVFQFAVSIILIVCTFTVTKQLSYVRKQNLGFETEHIIHVNLSPEINTKIFKDKLSQIAGIEDVSFSRWFPGNIQENWSMPLVYNGEETKVKFACENADAAYINIMELEIVQGRNFSDSLVSDNRAAILNEKAVKEWG
ncbi:MAG: ABC transporter permease, partial [Draconibacterium sp.]|nr:ABC transporter permease [Draconibacterium sp.]